MHLFALIVAVCVGALLPLQALLNARLGQLTFGPLFASLASFAVGTSALLALWMAWRPAAGGSGLPMARGSRGRQPGKAFTSVSTKESGAGPALTTLCSTPAGRV